MLDTNFPRLPGDIGNASTFDFPVRFKKIPLASPRRVVLELGPDLLEPFKSGARELEEEGVRAITTSCGFLALFQPQLAASVRVPMFTSSLMQMPVVHRMLRPDQKIGILTAHSERLTVETFKAVGALDVPYAVAGAENTPAFYNVFVMNGEDIDPAAAEAGVVEMATELLRREPKVGAFVCEGTNFSTFGPAVQEATGLPFYDIVTMTHWVYHAIVKRRVSGGFM
jgi:hypothetical protein